MYTIAADTTSFKISVFKNPNFITNTATAYKAPNAAAKIILKYLGFKYDIF